MLWLCSGALAGEPWFEDRMSFWEGVAYGQRRQRQAEQPPLLDDEAFDWQPYTDPTHPAFWDDGGGYTPPAPMLELARNPTPENAARAREWMRKKLEVSAELSQLLAEEEQAPPTDWRGVGIVYFYASSCPHCRRNKPVVEALRARGVQIWPVHVGGVPEFEDSVPYTRQIAEQFPVVGTPTFVITADGRKKAISGFADVERLEAAIHELRAGG